MNLTLTREKIQQAIIGECEFTQTQASEFVDSFFDEIASTLENGFDVRIAGFGNFILRDKAERPARDPRTGEVKTVSARRVVTFKTGQKMKNHVQKQLKSQ